ncbi:MAG: hypothetical protein MUC50_14260 [Myxococcota bacterium]|jgi:hypothetical protein|nr:hypothetical protein [Myxococcota bacterium]
MSAISFSCVRLEFAWAMGFSSEGRSSEHGPFLGRRKHELDAIVAATRPQLAQDTQR